MSDFNGPDTLNMCIFEQPRRRRCPGNIVFIVTLVTGLYLSAEQSSAQDDATVVAKSIVGLSAMPFTLDYNDGLGPNGEGSQSILKMQALVPFNFRPGWSVVSRTIAKIIDQNEVTPGSGHIIGLSDTTQIFYFTPDDRIKVGRDLTLGWSVGTAFLFPTATHDKLTLGKFGAGPSGTLSLSFGKVNAIVAAHHLWSIAGDDAYPSFSETILQPALSYKMENDLNLVLSSDAYYNWKNGEWAFPVQATVHKNVRFRDQKLNLSIGAKYWVKDSPNSPEGFGIRLGMTFLFEK